MSSNFKLRNLFVNQVMMPIAKEEYQVEEWICANASDFVSELFELFLFCEKDYKEKEYGFPKGISYLWEGNEVSGQEYVTILFEYFFEVLDDPTLFVEEDFPNDFKTRLSKMFTRMLRIFCILATVELEYFQRHEQQHSRLLLLLKRFIFFSTYWELIDFSGQDSKPLRSLILQHQQLLSLEFKFLSNHIAQQKFLGKYKDTQNHLPETIRKT